VSGGTERTRSTVSDATATPTRFEPPLDRDISEFWDGTREQRLLIPTCRSCGKVFWYPRPTCPHCLSADIDWRQSSGAGEVAAVSVMHRPANPLMADKVPYAVVLVDLDDGIRLMSNMVEVDANDVRVGMRVQLRWEPLTDGRNLWLFAPA
jgi:uncharacterized OB-fold protein